MAHLERQLLETAKIIEDQIDAAIEKLDRLEDQDLQAIERKRAAALKKEIRMKEEWITNGHGEYTELATEKEFFDVCKKSKNIVCHFYRTSTMRCKIVDKHLAILAPKHLETKFVKLDVERSPFLTQRLKIRVLPTIVLCKDAVSKDCIIGFDDLGGVDDFSTELLEWRIAQSDVINYSGDITAPPGVSNKPKNPFLKYKPKTVRGGCDDSDSD